MSVTATFNGTSYTLPTTDETGWGSNVTSFLQAVASNALAKSGGAFTLTAEVDFGATYGVKAAYFKSQTANLASAGALRFARADSIKWRNEANGADLTLGVDSSNNLEWEGVDVVTVSGTQTLTNKTLTSPTITGATVTSPTISGATLTTATITPEAWVTMSGFTNGWTAHATTPKYRKLPTGEVKLCGAIVASATGGGNYDFAAFTFPAGYRPAATRAFVVMTGLAAVGEVNITSAGVLAVVDYSAGVSVVHFLDQISFFVD